MGSVPPSRDIVVDVGIPAIGGSRSAYLVEAVESVLAQSFASWKLLISEDGVGSDSIRECLLPYLDDPRLEHIVVGKRIGIGGNFTNVINAGSGRYVAILNDDDRWESSFLEQRVEFLDRNPSCGLVFSAATIIDQDGIELGPTALKLRPGVHSSRTVLPMLYRANFIGAPTVLVRRTAYEAVGARYSDRIFSDHEMWLRIAAQFDVGCLGAWDTYYRIHASQTVSSRRTELAAHRLEVLRAVDNLDVPRPVRRAAVADAHVGIALDASERGERRNAFHHIARAIRTRPAVIVLPGSAARIVAAVCTTILGGRARLTLSRRRARRWRSGGAMSDARRAAGRNHPPHAP